MESDTENPPTVDEMRAKRAAFRDGTPDKNSDNPVEQVRAERAERNGR